MVANHDQDPKVAEHAVLQATVAAKSKNCFFELDIQSITETKNLFLDQSKNEVPDHQKDENDQGL